MQSLGMMDADWEDWQAENPLPAFPADPGTSVLMGQFTLGTGPTAMTFDDIQEVPNFLLPESMENGAPKESDGIQPNYWVPVGPYNLPKHVTPEGHEIHLTQHGRNQYSVTGATFYLEKNGQEAEYLSANELNPPNIEQVFSNMQDRRKERILEQHLKDAWVDFGMSLTYAGLHTGALVTEAASVAGAPAAIGHSVLLSLAYGEVGYQGYRLASAYKGEIVAPSMATTVSPEYGGYLDAIRKAGSGGYILGHRVQSVVGLTRGKSLLNGLAQRHFTGRFARLGQSNYDAYLTAAGIEGSFQTGAYLMTTDNITLQGAGYSFLRGSATGLVGRHIDRSQLGLLQKATGHGGLQLVSSLADQAVLDGRVNAAHLAVSGALGFASPLLPAKWFAPKNASSFEQDLRKRMILYPIGVYGPQFGEEFLK